MTVSLDAEPGRALHRGNFGETHMTEFRKAYAKITKAESIIRVAGIKFREKPSSSDPWAK